jgi:hypothetical protein
LVLGWFWLKKGILQFLIALMHRMMKLTQDVHSAPVACSMQIVHVPVMVVDWEVAEAVVIVPVR